MATGIARYEFRYFAHLGDPALYAAVAVACAAEQGAFWPLHDRFMAGDETLFTEAGIRRQVEFEGLEYGAFAQCLTEGETLPLVIASRNEGESRGVPGTPTVFVNGERVNATFEAIEEAVRRATAESESEE